MDSTCRLRVFPQLAVQPCLEKAIPTRYAAASGWHGTARGNHDAGCTLAPPSRPCAVPCGTPDLVTMPSVSPWVAVLAEAL